MPAITANVEAILRNNVLQVFAGGGDEGQRFPPTIVCQMRYLGRIASVHQGIHHWFPTLSGREDILQDQKAFVEGAEGSANGSCNMRMREVCF